MHRQRLGALIAAIGGLVFIEVSAGRIPGGPAAVLAVRILGAVAFALVVWFSVVRTRTDHPAGMSVPQPAPRAMGIYGASVAAEVAAFPLGALFLNKVAHQPALVLPWVIFVVGVHFLPFAAAFRAPSFRPLGWALIVLGVLGGVFALTVDESATAVAAVLAGVVLYLFSLGRLGRSPAKAS